MKIALCHFRVGETDGVSLEMDKWKKALELEGHKVIYIAGSAGKSRAKIIPGLHYQHPANNLIVNNAYLGLHDFNSNKELEQAILSLADEIEEDLIKLIQKENIDILVPNNILSLGWGLSAGIAFTRAIKKTKVKAICHHHDFHWERKLYSNPQFDFINDILNIYFPPVNENITHVCINQIARNELKNRFDIDAYVVPNVWDFDMQIMVTDRFNKNMRSDLGIAPNDIVVLQATRVVERKGIEIAIDFVDELSKIKNQLVNQQLYNGQTFDNHSKIHLVLAGKNEAPEYFEKLMHYAWEKKVDIMDISSVINHKRHLKRGSKTYSLWDAYSIADMVTYPSILEGWGNQFLEAIAAKLPIAAYKYPVFLTDIEKYKFNIVSFGYEHIMENNLIKIDRTVIKKAADEAINYLLDYDYREKQIQYNYEVAIDQFSIHSLRNLLKDIICNNESN